MSLHTIIAFRKRNAIAELRNRPVRSLKSLAFPSVNFSLPVIRHLKAPAREIREVQAADAIIATAAKADITSAYPFAEADADIAFASACFYFLNFFDTDKINVD